MATIKKTLCKPHTNILWAGSSPLTELWETLATPLTNITTTVLAMQLHDL